MNKMREKEKTGDVTVRGMAEVGFEDEQKEGDLRRKQREKHFRRRRRGVRKEEEEKRRRKSFNVGGISSNENSCAGSGTSFLLTAESCGGGSRSGSGSVLSTISASADRCFIGSNRDSLFPHLTVVVIGSLNSFCCCCHMRRILFFFYCVIGTRV